MSCRKPHVQRPCSKLDGLLTGSTGLSSKESAVKSAYGAMHGEMFTPEGTPIRSPP